MAVSSPYQSTLSVLVVDELPEPLEEAARLVRGAGHRVVARAVEADETADALARHQLDALVVAVHEDREHALRMIETLAARSDCPLVILFDRDDPAFVEQALDLGADAYADRETLGSLESAISLARRRHDEVHDLARQIHELESGGARRALIERAKGVVMERHKVDERAAYEMLRTQARSSRTTLARVAESVLEARTLF